MLRRRLRGKQLKKKHDVQLRKQLVKPRKGKRQSEKHERKQRGSQLKRKRQSG